MYVVVGFFTRTSFVPHSQKRRTVTMKGSYDSRYPETIEGPEIFHGNIYILQNTAQHSQNVLTLSFLEKCPIEGP
jgi:hypothetical protein